MRKLLQRKAKDPKAPIRGLEPAKVILTFVASLGDGAVSVPGLKAAAQIVLKVIDIAQKAQRNKEDCLIIADRAQQLTEAMIEALGDQQADIDPRLVRDLDRFQEDLKGILQSLEPFARPNLAAKVFKHMEYSDEIMQCKETLDYCFKKFLVYNTIALRLGHNNPHQGQQQDAGRLSHVHSFKFSCVPPPAPEIFHGREDFIAKAVSILEAVSPARIPILGAGGMGKTATALVILHHEQVQNRFQQQRYFVPCDAAVTPSILVNSIIQVLDISHKQDDDIMAILQAKLASLGLVLLVLDNFEIPWLESGAQTEVGDILSKITSIQGVSLILTMRGSAPPFRIQWTHLQQFSPLLPLHPDAAKAVFLTINPISLDSQEEKDLVLLLQEMDHVPLAIILIAQVSTGQSCQHMLQRWREEQTSLLQTQGLESDKMTSIDVSISHSLKTISVAQNPTAVELLSLISYLPDGLLHWEKNLQSVARDLKQVKHAVAVLLKVSLVYVNTSRTLKILSPIRHYMICRYPATKLQIQQLEAHYIAMIYNHTQVRYGPEFVASQKIILLENGNITAVFKSALVDHPYEQLVWATYEMSSFLYRIQPSTHLLDLLLDREGITKSINMKAKCLKLKGEILCALCNYDQALAALDEGQKLFNQIGDQQSAAQCLQRVGQTLRMQCRYVDAIKKVEESQRQFDETGHQLGAAQCLQTLGEIFRAQSRYPEAKEKLKEAQKQFDETDNRLEAAQCLQSLGDIFYIQDMQTEAKDKLEEAQRQFHEIGYQLGTIQCLRSLGDILYMQGLYPEAKKKLEEAQRQFNEVGHQLGSIQCLQRLGDILCMQGKYLEAQEMLENAQRQFKEIGHQLGFAQCLRSLSDILYIQAMYQEATEKLEDAQSQFNEIGNKLGTAQCLQRLGEILGMQNRYPEATEFLENAQRQFNEIGDQLGATQCLQKLGEILSMQSRYLEAKVKLEEAQIQFTKICDHQGAAQCLQSLGDIFYKQNMYVEAKEKLEEAQRQFNEIGHQLGATQCLQRLSELLYVQRRHLEAKEQLEEAQMQFSNIGHQVGAAQCLQRQGEILCMENRYPEAKDKLKDAQSQFAKIGHQLGTTQCLQRQGEISHMQCRYPEAKRQLLEAQIQFSEIGHKLGAAQCLQTLGNILYSQDMYPQAKEKLEEAQKQFNETGNQLEAAQCLVNLGSILYMQDMYSEAKEKLEEAQRQFTVISHQLGIAQCLQRLGDILFMQGLYPEAKDKLKEAQTQFNEVGDQLEAAQCLHKLDEILCMESRCPEARDNELEEA